ncbi:MAG: helix-turn-helix domain-containing protein [Rickettsiales bacterium]|jgi:transcriptional regulator with XRE-family HTH domain|nr:helix-turn-helix domain-containing protein [Rickettsiales bacterium]
MRKTKKDIDLEIDVESDMDKKINVYVGKRIQIRRSMLNMSQTELANACGVSFQQVQKYESADNRISASRLVQIGEFLKVPVAFFFDGLPNQIKYQPFRSATSVREPDPNDPFDSSDVMRMVQLYCALPSDEARLQIINMCRIILSGGNPPSGK